MGSTKLCPGSEKDITEVSGTSSPGSIPGRGTNEIKVFSETGVQSPFDFAPLD